MTPVESAVFWVAAVVAVLSAVGVISARSPIYSALSLILTLSQLAVLYLLLNAQFIAAVQILIYAGAIMVLFLFVITLLGVSDYPLLGDHLPGQRILSVLFSALLLACTIFFVAQAPRALTGAHGHPDFNVALAHNNVGAFGTQLFTTFVFPFEITPLLLLVAMVGAVALGRRPASAGAISKPSTSREPIEATESELGEPEKVEA